MRGSFAQEGGSSDGTQRRSKEMTLAESTTERDEPTELLGGLDSFGDGDEAKLGTSEMTESQHARG